MLSTHILLLFLSNKSPTIATILSHSFGVPCFDNKRNNGESTYHGVCKLLTTLSIKYSGNSYRYHVENMFLLSRWTSQQCASLLKRAQCHRELGYDLLK